VLIIVWWFWTEWSMRYQMLHSMRTCWIILFIIRLIVTKTVLGERMLLKFTDMCDRLVAFDDCMKNYSGAVKMAFKRLVFLPCPDWICVFLDISRKLILDDMLSLQSIYINNNDNILAKLHSLPKNYRCDIMRIDS